MAWWDAWPGRYELEIERLQHYGWSPEDISTDEELAAGYRVIRVQYPIDSNELTIRLCFPPEYPYFMALAFTDPSELLLERHHNPISGELCLLNGGVSWKPKLLIADIVAEKLPEVLQISEDPNGAFAREAEAPQGEPISGYLAANNKSLLLIDDIIIPPDATNGTFDACEVPGGGANRYALTAVYDNKRTLLSKASKQLCERLKDSKKHTGCWRRIEPMTVNKLIGLETLAQEIHKPTIERVTHSRNSARKLLAAVYSEEVSQGHYQDAWFGIEVSTKHNSGKKSRKFQPKLSPIFGAPYGTKQRLARSPELKRLEDTRVCIIGTGMLGSPFALQLARAGVKKLSLVDPDYIELSTIIRFALGASYAGWSKAEALQDYIGKNYPLVEVEPIVYRIGTVTHNPGRDNFGQMMAAIEQSDLIIDAAAEKAVSHYICHVLREMNKPSIAVTTRPGSWGGEVWCIQPTGPCWECFEHHNQVGGELPMPNGDDDSKQIQFGGCTQPTTIGYGFDADLVVLSAVRQAIGLLTGTEGGYPAADWNALTMNMRSAKGGIIAPTCQTFQLQPHPECSCQVK